MRGRPDRGARPSRTSTGAAGREHGARRWAIDRGTCGLSALLLVLLLLGLGRPSLWEDEAGSAVLGARVLAHGLPYAWDGQNWVTRERGMDANNRGLWIFEPWLAFYVTAASLALCGHTQFGARFLPAVCGWLAALVVLKLMRGHSKVGGAPLFAAVLLATSVPYLLYCRQSRYYPLVFLSEALFMLAFMDLRPELRSVAACSASLGLLFYTHPLNFAIFLPGALAAGLAFGRARLVSAAISSAAATVAALPWVLYSGMLRLGAQGTGFSSRGLWGLRALLALIGTSLYAPYYLMGCAAMLLFLPLMSARTIGRLLEEPLLRLALPLFVVPAGVATYLTAANVSSHSERYALTTLIPGVILLALLHRCLACDHPRLSYALLAVFALTPFAMVSPLGLNDTLPTLQGTPLRSPLWAFLRGTACAPRSPTDAIVGFLRPRLGSAARATLFVDWNPEGVLFHLPQVQIVRDLPFRAPPQWIVLRSGRPAILNFTLIGRISVPPPDRSCYVLAARRTPMEAAPDLAYIQDYVKAHPYRPLSLRADLADDNVPEFFEHKFTPARYRPPLILYEYHASTRSHRETAAEGAMLATGCRPAAAAGPARRGRR